MEKKGWPLTHGCQIHESSRERKNINSNLLRVAIESQTLIEVGRGCHIQGGLLHGTVDNHQTCAVKSMESAYHLCRSRGDVSVLKSPRANVGEGTLDHCDTATNRMLDAHTQTYYTHNVYTKPWQPSPTHNMECLHLSPHQGKPWQQATPPSYQQFGGSLQGRPQGTAVRLVCREHTRKIFNQCTKNLEKITTIEKMLFSG